MNLFLKLAGKLFGWEKQHIVYYDQFLATHASRLFDAGVEFGQVAELIRIAKSISHPEIVGMTPANILSDMADEIEAGRMTADEIIAKHGKGRATGW